MTFTAQIKIMPLKDLLDPQGKAVIGGLQNLGISEVKDVRIGKFAQMEVEAESKEAAIEICHIAATKLLANHVMEFFEISIL